jgi:hypothetical protein
VCVCVQPMVFARVSWAPPILEHCVCPLLNAHAVCVHHVCVQSKTITMSKLLHLLPPGTPDPSPYIYDTTMYAMAGLMSVAAVTHLMIKPVNPKFFEKVPADSPSV